MIKSISIDWKWFDLWVGLFIDKRHLPLIKKYYICPFPCLLITIEVLK